jgi:hypothetical protein
MKRMFMGVLIAAGAGFGCDGAVEEAPAENAPAISATIQKALTSKNLLARVALNPKHMFEFYEINGVVAYSELGEFGEAPTKMISEEDLKVLSPVEVYKKLTGEVAPTSLVHAQLRKEGRPPLLKVSDVSVTTHALNQAKSQTQAGGMAGGSCPFEIFKDVAGPLGPFCPFRANANFCWANRHWGFFDCGAGSNCPVQRHALSTICADIGTAEWEVSVWRGGPPLIQTFFQPQGTWRQWRTDQHCSFLGPCANFMIKFDLKPINEGRAQFGGAFTWAELTGPAVTPRTWRTA